MQIAKDDITEIKDESSFNKLKDALCRDVLPSWDTETTGLAYGSLPFMQTVYAADNGFVIDKRRVKQNLWDDVAKIMLSGHMLLGQNLYYDLRIARSEWNMRYKGRIHDTKLQGFLLDENVPHSLKIVTEALWPGASALEAQVKEWLREHNGGKANYDLVPFDIMSHYAVQDTFLTRKLHDVQFPKVEAGFQSIYDTECELTKVLVDMQVEGVRLDVPYLKGLVPSMEAKIKELEVAIQAAAGQTFNVSSDAQLADILYRKLGIAPKVFTEKGAPSTDKEALGALEHPIGKLVLEHRGLDTALHTFVTPWIDFADKDGYLHPNINQCGARSGRFSSSDPNAQNIPKRSPGAKDLRKAFIYPEGRVGGSNDQSQMEMVGFAFYSGDPTMKETLLAGRDLHRQTAAEIFKVPYDEVTQDQRRLGKGSNFSIIYGCGKAKLASFLSQDLYAGRYVSPKEAEDIITKYKMRFQQVTAFTQRTIQVVRQRPEHHVTNMFGRRCRLGIDKAYVGVNRLIQSWAADCMKLGMVKAWKYAQGTDLRMYLNVHDELKWHSSEKYFMDHARELNKCLSEYAGFSLPIKTEITKSLTNWAEEEEVKL